MRVESEQHRSPVVPANRHHPACAHRFVLCAVCVSCRRLQLVVKTHDEQQRNRRHEYDVQQKKIAGAEAVHRGGQEESDNEGTMNLQKTRQKQLEKMELIPEPPSTKGRTKQLTQQHYC